MLRLIHIDKRFGSQTAVTDVNLTVAEGEFFSLLGPSGCGKTTLLRMIAGLESISGGEIWLGNQRIDTLPPQQRPFNMVFQKYALFPHLTVLQNVAFGLRIKNVSAGEVAERSTEALELVGMGEYAERWPETLSGGQQQRIALARALVNRPKLLLLDEPLSALDQKLREHMQAELRLLQQRLGLMFVFVTHDQEEALVLSDRIGVMDACRLVEVGTPRELYEDPKSLFAATFVGRRSRFQGVFHENEGPFVELRMGNAASIMGHGGDFSGSKRGETVHALVQPERIRIYAPGAQPDSDNAILGRVVHRIFRGLVTELLVEVECGPSVRAFVPEGLGGIDKKFLELGAEVTLAFAPQDTVLSEVPQREGRTPDPRPRPSGRSLVHGFSVFSTSARARHGIPRARYLRRNRMAFFLGKSRTSF